MKLFIIFLIPQSTCVINHAVGKESREECMRIRNLRSYKKVFWKYAANPISDFNICDMRTTPMPICDFNKVAKQLYWNHTSDISLENLWRATSAYSNLLWRTMAMLLNYIVLFHKGKKGPSALEILFSFSLSLIDIFFSLAWGIVFKFRF